MEKKTFYIYSPETPQAQAIALFLHKYYPEAEISGVLLPGELNKKLPAAYKNTVEAKELWSRPQTGVHIPTTAASTELMLAKGDVSLGSITMKQDALKVFDKAWLLDICSELGVPVPKTWQTPDETDSFPIFYKSSYEKGKGSRGIAHTHVEMPSEEKGDLIFQEFINSKGTYGVAFLADQGFLRAIYTHFESESVPASGGSAVVIEHFEDSRLNELTEMFIKRLNYSGWGLAEFKYCPKRDDYVFMEINAKFWASCEFTFRNEPAFLELLFGIKSEENPVQKMIFVNRVLKRGIFYVFKKSPFIIKSRGQVKMRMYSGWSENLAEGMLPGKMIRTLKILYRKLKTF